MTEQLLQELIDFIKNASPVVWDAFIRQVYMDALQMMFFGIVFLVAAYILAFFAKKYYKIKAAKDKEGYYTEDESWLITGFVAGGSIAAMVAFSLMTTALKGFINPNYYAIKNIISSISGQ